LADIASPLPILADIARWNPDSPQPLEEWLVGWAPKYSEQLRDAIRSGETFLLLDGLDELGRHREGPNGDWYDPRERFMEYMSRLPYSSTVVTCRQSDYDDLVRVTRKKLTLDGAVALEPLTLLQIRSYLAEFPNLYDLIVEDIELFALAQTPLLLRFIRDGFAVAPEGARSLRALTGGELRDAIFANYIHGRYFYESAHANRQGTKLALSYEDTRRYLELLAKDSATTGGTGILDQRSVEHSIPKEVRSCFLDLVVLLNSLLPTGDGGYRFAHLRLRDYLAYAWATVHIKASSAIERAEAADVLGMVGDERAVRALIGALCSDLPWYEREHLIYGPYADEEATARGMAAVALGRIGDKRAVEPLIAVFEQYYENWRVRGWAASALAALGDRRAVGPLIAALNHSEYEVRECAAAALGTMRAVAAVTALGGLLKDERAAVRSTAASALEKIGTAEALTLLKES
jgi:hypothetical protein